MILLWCTVLALVLANSPWAGAYHHLWETQPSIPGLPAGLTLSLHQWVNDGLMAIFFFVVGLEIRREFLAGSLASRRSAMLPIAAALGGMVVPALLYTLTNINGVGIRGWGIPMATDIAFALGILALVGTRVPSNLRIFLGALAIVDDLGAIVVIALFYTSALHGMALCGVLVILGIIAACDRAGAQSVVVYLVLGVVLWAFVLMSGIHPTIAGVLLAFLVPNSLQKLEQTLHGAVTYLIVPLFAIANAGVTLSGDRSAFTSRIALGIIAGLAIGKPLGIMLASYGVVKAKVATLPTGVSWRHLHASSWLAGIGFTMSLFVAGLAFRDTSLVNTAKLGVIVASTVAGLVGYVLLRRSAGQNQ